MMRSRWLGAVTAALVIALGGCQRTSASAGREAPPAGEVPFSEAVYVDVRTPEEYAAGHVEGAILIPVDELDTRWRELEPYRDRRVVVYCRTGRRSGIALEFLRERGFDDAVNGGGLHEVAAGGAPVVR